MGENRGHAGASAAGRGLALTAEAGAGCAPTAASAASNVPGWPLGPEEFLRRAVEFGRHWRSGGATAETIGTIAKRGGALRHATARLKMGNFRPSPEPPLLAG